MKRSTVAEVALVGVAAVWGLTFVMVDDAIAVIPSMTFLAYRFIAAAMLVGLIFRRRLASLGRAGLRAGAGMGVFLTAGYVFQTIGLEYTSSSNAGFITGLFVVLTPIFGAVFLRQRVGSLGWAAASASAFGLVLLSGSGEEGRLLGDLLVLGCAISFAFHILVTGAAVKTYDTGALLFVQLAGCGIFCLLVAGAAGDLQVPAEGNVYSALAVTALLATALGFFIQTYAQKHSSPARTALILASEPAFAGLFAYLIKGETRSPVGWLGAALIVGAIVAVEAMPYLRRTHPVPER